MRILNFFTEEGQYDEFFGGQKLADYFINDIAINTVGQVQTQKRSKCKICYWKYRISDGSESVYDNR